MTVSKDKPTLVAAAFNATGHTGGLIQISQHLIKKGYRIYFIAGSDFQASIEKIGAEFIENPFRWEKIVASAPPGREHDELWILEHVFGASIPSVHRVLKETLERVRREHPHSEVVLLHELMFGGVGPFIYGAPLPQGYSSFPKVINYHTTIFTETDGRIPPYGPGLPYDPTPENLALWRSISDQAKPLTAGLVEYYNNQYKALGATRRIEGNLFDIQLGFGNVTIMTRSPSLEYPIHATKHQLRLIGGLPPKPLSDDFAYPTWWPTITANAALPDSSPDRKKIVFVSQGTVHRDYADLIIPTINALAKRSDLIVVATLGARGALLDDSVNFPDNAIVVDYLPYDALLPYADVFVCNAGYNGFIHSVMNGVPLVCSGLVTDKAETSARTEWAGVAVNLRAQRPDEKAIREGVDKVLAEPRYKQRAMELKRENEAMDPLARVEEIIEEVLAGPGNGIVQS